MKPDLHMSLTLAALIGYLLGSFPSGVVITRLAGAADPRGIGSRNIGATNVLRTGRKDLAALTLLLDALKGAAAVLIVRSIGPGWGEGACLAAAAGAFIGHLFPIFIGFRGGKGVATFLGCLAALAWPAALGFALVWIAMAVLTRYSSLSALVASAATPPMLAALGHPAAATVFALLAVALWIKHSANIGRLWRGAESRIGQRRENPT